jgi:hypothetical protein
MDAVFAKYAEAHSARQAFTSTCVDMEQAVTREADAQLQLLQTALTDSGAAAIQLPDNSIVYIKTSRRVSPVSEGRLGAAVEALTAEQLEQAFQHAKTTGTKPTMSDVLAACVTDNLQTACLTEKHTPCVVRRRPKDLPESVIPAPATPAIESVARQYQQLKSRLTAIRGHKRAGSARCRDAQRQAEPAIVDFLQTHHREKQDVRFVTECSVPPAAPAGLTMPELPCLLPEHGTSAPPPKRRKIAAPAMDIVMPPSLASRITRVTPRTGDDAPADSAGDTAVAGTLAAASDAATVPTFQFVQVRPKARPTPVKVDAFIPRLGGAMADLVLGPGRDARNIVSRNALSYWADDAGKSALLQSLLNLLADLTATQTPTEPKSPTCKLRVKRL